MSTITRPIEKPVAWLEISQGENFSLHTYRIVPNSATGVCLSLATTKPWQLESESMPKTAHHVRFLCTRRLRILCKDLDSSQTSPMLKFTLMATSAPALRMEKTRMSSSLRDNYALTDINATNVAAPYRDLKEPQAPLMLLRAVHKTKIPGFAGEYLVAYIEAHSGPTNNITIIKALC